MQPEPQTRVGVGVIIRRWQDRTVLLGRRRGSHGAGEYSFPGGHKDFLESPEACALRENDEETGAAISIAGRGPWTWDPFPAEGKDYITLYVVADWISREPELLEPMKCAGWSWHKWTDLPRPLFQGIATLLDDGFDPFTAFPRAGTVAHAYTPPPVQVADGMEARVAVATLVRRAAGRSVLMGLRQGSLGAGEYGLPGGKKEFFEAPFDTARRETEEESGLLVRPVHRGPWTWNPFPVVPQDFVTCYVVADDPGQEPVVREPGKCRGWQWAPWDNLPKNVFPGVARVAATGYDPFRQS